MHHYTNQILRPIHRMMFSRKSVPHRQFPHHVQSSACTHAKAAARPSIRNRRYHRSTRSQQTLHHNIIAIYPFVGTQKSNCFPNAHGESLHVLRIVPHSSLHFSSFRPAGKGRGKSGSSSRALLEVPRGEVHTHSHNEVKVSSPGTHAFIYIHASSQAA